jgi:antitoxin PrlF
MNMATISSKGKIRIPADVRHALHLVAGDRVEFVEVGLGRYEFVAATRSVTELKGMFSRAKRTVSIDEMNRAIETQGALRIPCQ